MLYREVQPVTLKDQEIPDHMWDPHYNDTRFTESRSEGLVIFVDPALILTNSGFGARESNEGLGYTYSDRLAEHLGYSALQKIRDEIAADGSNRRTAGFIEKVLQRAFNDESIWLGRMKAGVNRATGYSYHIYGYSSDK